MSGYVADVNTNDENQMTYLNSNNCVNTMNLIQQNLTSQMQIEILRKVNMLLLQENLSSEELREKHEASFCNSTNHSPNTAKNIEID